MRFLLAKCKLSETIITIALYAKNKGRGGGVAYFKQKGVKIAPMAIKTTFSDFYIAE